nr:hypothetical protein [uncultured Pedobacter sp.]
MKNRPKTHMRGENLSDSVATKIINGQRKVAIYLNEYTRRSSKVHRVCCFLLFVAIFGGYSSFLLIRALF